MPSPPKKKQRPIKGGGHPTPDKRYTARGLKTVIANAKRINSAIADFHPPPDEKGVDWTKIRLDFVTTHLHPRALALANDVALSVLQRRRWDEGWDKQREAFHERAFKNALERTREDRVRQLVAVRTLVSDTALSILDEVSKSREFWGMSPKMARDAAGATTEAYDLAMRSLGLEGVKIPGEDALQTPTLVLSWAPDDLTPPEVLIARGINQLGKNPREVLAALGLDEPAEPDSEDPTA